MLPKAILVIGAVACLGLCGYAEDNAGGADLVEFQGEWKPVSYVFNGGAFDKAQFGSQRWIFRGDKYTIKDKFDRTMDFQIVLDPTSTPKEIEARYCGDDESVKKLYAGGVRGIYRFHDGMLERCYVVGPDAHRPKVFESKRGSKTVLVLLRKVPASEESD